MASHEQPDEAMEFHALPPVSANLAGSTHHVDKTYKVEVSNKAGYLCHTQVDAHWDLPPRDVFDIMVYPNNTKLFRDIKHVGGRTVVSEEATKRVVMVEQVGEMRVLWMTRKYSTWLDVVEDWSDEQALTTGFTLRSSDVLQRFTGSWELRPREVDGKVTGTIGVLHHDVLPKGVPPFLQHVPVLGGLLRGISMRAVRRVMEDLQAAVEKIQAGHRKGKTTLQTLQDLCGVYHADNPLPPTTSHVPPVAPVKSFALDLHNNDDDDADGSSTVTTEDNNGGGEAAADGKRPRASSPSSSTAPNTSGGAPQVGDAASRSAHNGSRNAAPAATAAAAHADIGGYDVAVPSSTSSGEEEEQHWGANVVPGGFKGEKKTGVATGAVASPGGGGSSAAVAPGDAVARDGAAADASVPWGV